MEQIVIKPCPFCGHIPEVSRMDISDRARYFYACTNERCLIQPTTTGYHNISMAAKSWNRRGGKDD